jgi:16S rRNA C967 or C1407 C5-methylase (RsmB/RsmF family)
MEDLQMAFSIKQVKAKLQEYGVPAEQLDTAAEYFCSAHKTDLDSVIEQRDAYKRDADKLPGVQAELDKLKNAPDDGFKAKYEREHQAFEDYKKETEAKETLAAKKAAYTEICKDAGLNDKGIAKAIKYADWDSVELGDDGKIADAKTHIKNLKEEWAEHVVQTNTRGTNTPNPPTNNAGSGAMTREQIYERDESGRFKLDAIQRQQALSQLIAQEAQKGS